MVGDSRNDAAAARGGAVLGLRLGLRQRSSVCLTVGRAVGPSRGLAVRALREAVRSQGAVGELGGRFRRVLEAKKVPVIIGLLDFISWMGSKGRAVGWLDARCERARRQCPTNSLEARPDAAAPGGRRAPRWEPLLPWSTRGDGEGPLNSWLDGGLGRGHEGYGRTASRTS